jgi:hypothetical protein
LKMTASNLKCKPGKWIIQIQRIYPVSKRYQSKSTDFTTRSSLLNPQRYRKEESNGRNYITVIC